MTCTLQPVPGHPLLRHCRLFQAAEAAVLMEALLAQIAWNEGAYLVAGRSFRLPRLQAWYADPGVEYRYAQQLLNSHAWIEPLLHLRHQVEALTGQRFNAVLVNLYRDGTDCVGWHADDEPDLGPAPVIASLSLGASRTFSVRRKGDEGQPDQETFGVPVHAGDLLVMDAPFQRDWQHAILAEPESPGSRMNLTFRQVWAEPETPVAKRTTP